MLSEPLIILSVCIGALNIIERILRKSTKYNKLLSKIGNSKEKLISLSQNQLSIRDSNDDILLDALGFIDEIIDLSDIDFKIPE